MYLKSLALYKFLFQFVNEFTQGCIQCVTDPKQIDLTPAAASRDVSPLIDHEDAADIRGLTSPLADGTGKFQLRAVSLA